MTVMISDATCASSRLPRRGVDPVRAPGLRPRPRGQRARSGRATAPSRRVVRRVAVLVDTSTTWGRRILRGVHLYCREHGSWEIFVEPRGQLERLRLPRGWAGDGVIARISNAALAEELQATRLPVVNVSGIKLEAFDVFPRVTTDLVASGKMAARHFIERGFQHFAYLDLEGLEFVQEHRKAFESSVLDAGGSFTSQSVKPAAGAEPDWRLDLAVLGQWVRSLPKPVALLCWNAGSAREILFACHEAGIHVPEEVAVLSQADDELLCETALIPISGISVASDRIGYQAASILDGLLHGLPAPSSATLVAPGTIVARQSTQTIAMSDPVLVKAVSYIRQNAGRQSLSVQEIARHAGASRRVLERRFAEGLKRSPAEEVRRVRLEDAKQLLAETRLSMARVAEAAGFCSQSHFSDNFSRQVGLSPLRFRKRNFGRLNPPAPC